ncbi:putative F-box/FBD/LRR-repeat protein At4g13965 isoform X3 [Carex rostrata]
MANSPTDSDPIDRLSNLPDALLITIISFLPIHIAARTSVVCRRFRHLWKASPSLALISYNLPRPRSKDFIAMAKRALLHRNPSHPLHSLCLEVSRCGSKSAIETVPSLLAKARSLDLRHLTMECFNLLDLLPILRIVFAINSLRCLSLHRIRNLGQYTKKIKFPSGIKLTFLRSLSLQSSGLDVADLNKLLSELCSLEDLHIDVRGTPRLVLSSQTIRKLKLIITYGSKKHDIVGLSLPLLESLHFEIKCCLGKMSHIHANVPLLTKAVIKLGDSYNVSTIDGLLNCISHVEELSLHLDAAMHAEHPIPILLKSGKDVPHFHNLKHLDVTLCFHDWQLSLQCSIIALF